MLLPRGMVIVYSMYQFWKPGPAASTRESVSTREQLASEHTIKIQRYATALRYDTILRTDLQSYSTDKILSQDNRVFPCLNSIELSSVLVSSLFPLFPSVK